MPDDQTLSERWIPPSKETEVDRSEKDVRYRLIHSTQSRSISCILNTLSYNCFISVDYRPIRRNSITDGKFSTGENLPCGWRIPRSIKKRVGNSSTQKDSFSRISIRQWQLLNSVLIINRTYRKCSNDEFVLRIKIS